MNLKLLVEHLVETTQFFSPQEDKARRKTVPHRIKFKGKYIKTFSGKTVWPSKGAAANALNLELGRRLDTLVHSRYGYGTSDYQVTIKSSGEKIDMSGNEKDSLKEEYFKEMRKYIEFVPVNE